LGDRARRVRHRGRDRPAWFVTPATSESPHAGTAADGELTWVEQRDRRLVAIKNLDPALAGSVAAAAFDPPAAERARRARPPLRASTPACPLMSGRAFISEI
jgi:hypothetical protein